MMKITRRNFIKQIGGGMLVFAGTVYGNKLSAETLAGQKEKLLSCPACKARYYRPSTWKYNGATHRFCPGCGINLDTQSKQLDTQFAPFKSNSKTERQVQQWEAGELPFLNPSLVAESRKPIATVEQIKFK